MNHGRVPLFLGRVSCGFPSPADDYAETTLTLDALLVAHPAATFYVRVSGDLMNQAAIYDGDILVVKMRPTCQFLLRTQWNFRSGGCDLLYPQGGMRPKVYALVDCNNFYVSVSQERTSTKSLPFWRDGCFHR